MQKLYVGNLPESASDADIEVLFSQFGDVDSVKMTSAGVAYVEMPEKFAEMALESLDGHEFRSAELVVSPAGLARWAPSRVLHSMTSKMRASLAR